MADRPKVALVAGTRPEGVKLAPLVPALREHGMRPVLVDTGQQPGLVAGAISPFGLTPDVSLSISRPGGGLAELIAVVSMAVDEYLDAEAPDAVVVQGDTTTAMATALVARMRGTKVVHLEAGLRTYDDENPFPEEINRRLIGQVAALNLAPTNRARDALLGEGIDPSSIVVTGNTVIDALRTAMTHATDWPRTPGRRRLTVTAHRREAWGEGIDTVVRCIRRLVAELSDLEVVFVAHPNPTVRDAVRGGLADTPRVTVVAPLIYDDMLGLLMSSDAVLTDSGGIQEEAPTIGLGAVVTRWHTERPEGVEAGWADLVGFDEDAMFAAVLRRLNAPKPRPAAVSPYGDGQAARRSAEALAWMLMDGRKPDDWDSAPPPAVALPA